MYMIWKVKPKYFHTSKPKKNCRAVLAKHFTRRGWIVVAERSKYLLYSSNHFYSRYHLRLMADITNWTVIKRHFGKLYNRGLQTFLSKGHISYYTSVRGPDILRNVIVLGYLTLHQINKFFVNILFFHYWQSVSTSRTKLALRTGFGPRAVVWTPLLHSNGKIQNRKNTYGLRKITRKGIR